NDTVSGNYVAANGFAGIDLYSSSDNTVSGNNVTRNTNGGIYLSSSTNNTVYHNNFIGNVAQASVDSASLGNAWDNGYPSGGNFWSDYNGTDLYSGPYQNLTGSDGIGDTPYPIDSNNTDHYPLVNLFSTGPLSIPISPNSATLDIGQSALFNSTISGGTLPYTYQWYVNGTAVTGANLSSWTFAPSYSGFYNVYANLTDNIGFVAESNVAPVIVNPPPSVSVSPSAVVIDVGQSQLFTSTVSGGTLPYSYQWYLDSAPVSGANNATWTFTPASSGSYSVYVNVTDGVNFVAESKTAQVTVNPPLTASVSPSSVVMDVGQSQLFTSTVTGGTSPYSYQWYLNAAPVSGAANATWTFTPNSSGPYTVCVNVTDAANFVAESNTAQVTANPPLTVSVSPSSVVMDVGQSQLFTSTVTGGTSPYSYQWYLNAAPVSGATNATWTFTAASQGIYAAYVNVTDMVSIVATSATVPVTVNGQPSVSIMPVSVTLDVGQSQTFASNVTGGTSPYSYQWFMNGGMIAGANSSSWALTSSLPSSYIEIYAEVTDSNGTEATSNIANVNVNASPSVSILPSSIVIALGQSQTFNSTVTGGTFPYAYQWFLNGTAVSGANFSGWVFTPASEGSYTIYANITDSNGVQATSNNATITVGPRTPEVTMTNVECSKTVIGRGYGANVTVTAVDLATYSEMVNITVYANTTIIGSQNVTLPSGNSTDFTFAWNTTAFAYGNYTVSACAVPLTNETNPATSSFTGGSVAVTIMGDVNGDFKVDMKDIALVARAFGSKPGSSNWNPNADVNSDGKIDMKDIALVGRNFGQHYP
ncbi:MAG: PKD domain-containing protein, partial [Candidatus Bathyarchaeia archaeon]